MESKSKDAFEKWFTEVMIPAMRINGILHAERDLARSITEMAWQASRAALVVELPSLKQVDSGERYVWSDGAFNFKQDVIEAIRAVGITVKGEGDVSSMVN